MNQNYKASFMNSRYYGLLLILAYSSSYIYGNVIGAYVIGVEREIFEQKVA